MTPSPPAVQTIRIGHSPDPDDAFMWWPLADFSEERGPGGRRWTPRIDTGPYRFVHVLEDIESLNQRAQHGELEITAVSIHQYPYIADRYALTSCGASMGDGYGPMVIARRPYAVSELPGLRIAVPGERTSAFLALSLLLGGRPRNYCVVPFDQIIQRVAAGEFDAGLIIHEGQLTYGRCGLERLVDLGEWWTSTRGLPLPLGGNAIRRDVRDAGGVCRILQQSIQYALDHRSQAIEYAMHYARDMGADLADRFVGMYVNQYTLDYGPRGRQAVQQFLKEAADAGLIPHSSAIDFVEPACPAVG
jgi:1,4-dihydroxy-6-naphthoate synthase